jgi:hypothetical protein
LTGRILATNAPNGCPGVLIRRSRHRAGVQYYDFRLGERGSSRQTALPELALDRSAIGLGGATAKILYVEAGHGYPCPMRGFVIERTFFL